MKTVAHVTLRMPQELAQVLKEQAEKNRRSMHNEVIHRLEQSVKQEAPSEKAPA